MATVSSLFNQTKRLLSITTPVDDILMLYSFTGHEGMSQLFHYDLQLLSTEDTIDPSEVVGKPVSWNLTRQDGSLVYWNGIVKRLSAGARFAGSTRQFSAEIVPWTWFLTLVTDCRIFQNMTVPQIIEEVFDDLGFTDYEINCSGVHPTWDYCVQYRETSFAFVSRLMELEGIFYFYRHEEDKHIMVIADQKSAYTDCIEKYVDYTTGTIQPSRLTSWDHQYTFRTGKWSQTDYNFESPGSSTYSDLFKNENTIVQLPNNTNYEKFDYPGGYMVKSDAETKVRMEAEEVDYNVVNSSSDCATFTVGGKFTVRTHDNPTEIGKSWAITGLYHQATDESYLGGKTQNYRNTFTSIPDSTVYRPPLQTPKPFVKGPQTAVVVGPAGEEIYVDQYARVKVQFYWDREGNKDENSSCWIRVSEQWAGQQWGFIFHPRIGQEVIVDFLEGDPDRPIITGRVYNGQLMPPYELDANKTQSGIKTRSSKDGGPANYNEIRFEDLKGEELLTIHAEKDQSIEVEHDESHWVGNDRTKNIDHDETVTVKHDRTETVENDETITIKHDRTETVENDENIEIKNDRSRKVGNDDSLDVDNDRSITVKGKHSLDVTDDRSVTVKEGDDTHEIMMGKRDVTLDMGDDSLTLKMGDQSVEVKMGKSSTTAMQSIELTVGKNSITIDQEGITLKGLSISIEGQMELEAKSPSTTVKGDGDLTLKGGTVNIN
jgi:type VI secretion system secreted protein VgrG